MQLSLDTKLVRKGKPIGLPYQGSKKRVAKQIVAVIRQNFGGGMKVYDLFGGGGSVTAECLLNGVDVHYNDLCPISGAMLRRVIGGSREWLKTLCIGRDEFLHIRSLLERTVDEEIKLLVNSFGNNRKDYLYGKDKADIKHRIALEIIAKHDVFAGYRQTDAYKAAVNQFGSVEQLQRLQQMANLQQLERLQQLQQLQQLEFTAKDYRAFSDVKGAVLYLDPPYENTDMSGYSQDGFDSVAFYDWAHEMAKHNIVLISSYTISDSRFKPVFDFASVRSLLKLGGGQIGSGRYERLFMAA